MSSKYAEIEFKGNRKAIYLNDQEYPLKVREHVVVQTGNGEDLGKVNRLMDEVSSCKLGPEGFEVLRKASESELKKLESNRRKENEARVFARQLVKKHQLEMKLSTVEYQFDGKKVTFFFTAADRVDFRELVKDLARKYKARIELRQIGARDEAKKIGGCGSCGGNTLCCAILSKLEPISSRFAKDQMLTNNITKLTGMCGRLKCCLKYEQQMYVDELNKYPPLETKLKMPKGAGFIDKIDIFRELLHVRYNENEHPMEKLTLDEVLPFVDN